MFHPGARMAHAALKGEDPDFSDRPGGVIYEDDQADWVYVKDLARGIQLLQTADTLGSRIYTSDRAGRRRLRKRSRQSGP